MILIIILVIFYLIVTIKAQIKVANTLVFDKKQKRINSLLIWLIPFIWIIFLNDLLESQKGSHFFKVKREDRTNDEGTDLPNKYNSYDGNSGSGSFK